MARTEVTGMEKNISPRSCTIVAKDLPRYTVAIGVPAPPPSPFRPESIRTGCSPRGRPTSAKKKNGYLDFPLGGSDFSEPPPPSGKVGLF